MALRRWMKVAGHIVTDDQILSGEPIIKGTRTSVRAVVEAWRLGVLAEEIPSRLPI